MKEGLDAKKEGGVLWLVAQEQVPIGRMLAAYGKFRWVEAALSGAA